MSFSEEKFRDHIKQIVKETAPDSDRPLTLPELKELAESMGVSEREWNELMIKAEQSLNLALGHLKVENYTDAIEMAEEATSINPYIKDGNAILAQCYYKLGLVDKNDELFIKSANYARMELKNDPLDSVALNVLSAIEAIQKEGKFSGKMIRTVAYVVGALVLVFVLLFMCTRSVNDSSAPNESVVSGSGENELNALNTDVKTTESVYLSSIERRNEIALEIVAQIEDRSIRNEFKAAIIDYDYDEITQSEQRFRLALSEVSQATSLSKEMNVRLQGGENRINAEKRRYLSAVSSFNSSLESSNAKGKFKPIEPRN